MTQTITIDPITRIEGHAKITLHLNDSGTVERALFHTTQFRGFEKFCEGRPYYEMPSLMARSCGICPVAHLVAGAKACDQILAVKIPDTAGDLRRIMNFAQIIQSHALCMFYLSAPDFIFGFDANPATRNIAGLAAKNPQLARDGIRLRQFGQQTIELLGGKRIHPAWIVAGGVSEPLKPDHRDRIQVQLPEVKDIAMRALATFKPILRKYESEMETFGNFPSLFMGLVDEQGNIQHYDGKLRVVDSAGNVITQGWDPARYQELIAEAVEPWTFMKFPYYKPMGYPNGMYRVGPLARLNVIARCGTPLADAELDEFRSKYGYPASSSYHNHLARLIEVLYSIERLEQKLSDDSILDTHVRAGAAPNARDGIGVAEAPRGTIIHHYHVDQDGVVEWANMIIATGHNNLAMNRSILQVARSYVNGDKLTEGMLNRVEAVIRAYDPCLSCSTHAVGQMPLHIELYDGNSELRDTLVRDSA
ncbi:MAG: Ni/Fe hydrogenase subunit alpha [Calditrichaeota bacterium]|nr:Ni/Fe hydrogenase subunit alpha [Calditrichota bacterium]MCB9367327.1 Ni/Fe hydrogenase subunit alpha [Calditrichota bacterium]